MSRKRTTPLEQVDELLEEYTRLEQRAETLIDGYVSGLLAKSPGVPREVLRQCTIDARSDGYSHPKALRFLRTRISEEA